jgi:ClpP class serine protease
MFTGLQVVGRFHSLSQDVFGGGENKGQEIEGSYRLLLTTEARDPETGEVIEGEFRVTVRAVDRLGEFSVALSQARKLAKGQLVSVKVVGRTSGSSTYVNYDAVRIESLSVDGKGVAASALPKA